MNSGLASSKLDVADPSAAEAAFAVGEVELPDPLEAAVEAERAHAVELCEKVLAPAAQRADIVGVRSSRWTGRRSVARATEREIALSEGRQPPGKTRVFAKLCLAFSTP